MQIPKPRWPNIDTACIGFVLPKVKKTINHSW